eukprot:9257367-Pyramimonas_sp.AAC.1
MLGEPDDDRPLYHPYRNVIQRFLNDSPFHHQMTGAREAAGHVPWTIEDMRDACDIHARSVSLGLAGRKNWWLNEGRMDRGTRQQRGLVTIAFPAGMALMTEPRSVSLPDSPLLDVPWDLTRKGGRVQ